MAQIKFDEVAVTPSPPVVGQLSLYAKNDDVLYIQDSDGNEVPIGTPDAITDLTGDVSASGPGSVPATVNSVGGKTASAVATATTTVEAATTSNTPNTLVLRDGSGNISAANFSGSFSGTSSGTNTGDVTVSDTNSVDLTVAGQLLSADVKLSTDPASALNVKATTTIKSGAGAGLHVELPYATPVQIGTSNNSGSASSFALSDHVHSHGNQTSGTLHAAATTSVNGFMSSTDKTKLDNATALATADTLALRDANADIAFRDVTERNALISNKIELTQTTTPTTPASTKADIYLDNSSGFSRLRYLDETGSVQTILRDTIFTVKNTSGSTITKGQVVYATGSDTGVLTVGLAKADSSNTVPVLGLMYETTANGGFGRVISIGILSNIDTSAFSVGSRVYLSASTAGALTSTKPVSPNIWQRVGIVLTSNATTGTIEVRPLATHGEESGTNTGFTLNPVTLTDAATINVNAALGNTFSVTLGGNRTLAAPTNPVDGQKIVFRIRQDGTGGRTLTFDSIYRFGLDIISFTPSVGANKLDYIGFMYNAADSRWDCIAVSKGFN